jgi:hypothetical protein
MDDRPVSEDRLEVIDSGSSERLYSAMRDQAERGRDFQRRVRWMWLRRELVMRPADEPGALLVRADDEAALIDLRDESPVSSTEEPAEQLQEDSA